MVVGPYSIRVCSAAIAAPAQMIEPARAARTSRMSEVFELMRESPFVVKYDGKQYERPIDSRTPRLLDRARTNRCALVGFSSYFIVSGFSANQTSSVIIFLPFLTKYD